MINEVTVGSNDTIDFSKLLSLVFAVFGRYNEGDNCDDGDEDMAIEAYFADPASAPTQVASQ